MLETCLKNCPSIPSLITKNVMDEIVTIGTGKRGYRNQDEALRLIQSWGKTFERRRGDLPIFYETYMHLKMKGIEFPPLPSQEGVVGGGVVNNPSTASSAASTSSQSSRINE